MRIGIITVFSVLGLSLLSFNVTGQTSLTDLVKYAVKHSHDIQKLDLQNKEANYIRKEAIGHGLPQIEASASYSKMLLPEITIPTSVYQFIDYKITDESTKQMLSGVLDKVGNLGSLYMASAGIQVTQLLYSQAYWVGVKTTQKTQELYTLLKSKTEEDVIADVAGTYYQTGSLMLQLETLNKSIQNLKEIYRITELSYQNDMVKESTVDRLKVTITNLEVTKKTIENGIAVQLNYLKALTGMPGDSALNVSTATVVNDFVANEPTTGFSVESVPSYLVLKKQDEIYGQQIKQSRATYYPTLAAFGKLNYSSYNLEAKIGKMSNMTTLGLSFSMPLFTSGVTHAKVEQTLLKRAELNEDIMKTKDLLSVNYNNAYLEYQTSRDMIGSQKENMELALKVYNQTSSLYQEGMSSMADLLNVNSDYLQADNSYNQQIMKCKMAEIKMLNASGNLKSLVK